jgi:hypothetical protein
MTVMDAPRTGGIEIARSQTPKVSGIVARLAGPVWTLLEADMMAAALELVRREVPAFEEAWRSEYVGITTQEAPEKIVQPGCTSVEHAGLNCASALAEGQLEEGRPFCAYCSEQQLAQTPAPAAATETGTIVHIVTDAGPARTKASKRQAS